MPNDPKNLGKAWVKVVLYDGLPNLVINTNKLRQHCDMIWSFQDDTAISRNSFGVQYLGVPSTAEEPSGPESSKYQAGCMIPQICYEPWDNWMWTSYAATTYYNIYWKALSGSGAAGIPPVFKRIVLSGLNAKIDNATALPTSSRPQNWIDEEQNVQLSEYSESYYFNSGLGFDSEHLSMVYTPLTGSTSGSSVVQVPSPNTRRFAHQTETGVGVWWGARTAFDYKVYGCPFWVTIRPAAAYTPAENKDDTTKNAYLAIMITRDSRTAPLVLDEAGHPVVPQPVNYNPADNEYLLVISNRGETFVTYTVEGKAKKVNVDLPNLSEAFQRGEEIRVGFLIACGRLCVYCDQNTYSFVDVLGQSAQDIGRGFNFVTRGSEIYGYGCSAHINVCPMTFYRKCWYIIPEMSGDVHYSGNVAPEKSIGSSPIPVTPPSTFSSPDPNAIGAWSNGALISWSIPKEQYENAGNRRMYAAQFWQYKEIDFVEPSHANFSIGPGSWDQQYTYQNNARNWWGNIFIVRANAVPGVSSKKFWFCYMESDFIADNYISNQGSGFPIIYNIFTKKDQDVLYRTGPDVTTFGSYDITAHVVSVQISEELDNVKPSAVIKKASIVVYDPESDNNDYALYLTRARGVRIWMKWSVDGSMPDMTYSDLVFNGIAYGETSSLEPGKNTISFTCFDYWHILDRMKIKNSPFYDGFELASVIKDLSERAGITAFDNINHTYAGYLGSVEGVPWHFLGSGFSFDKPMHRYEAQLSIKDCILKAVNAFPYYLIFGVDGILYINVVPGDFDFSKEAYTWDPWVYKTYYREFNSAITDSTPEKLILNEVSMTSTLSSSLYNSFFIKGVNRTTNELILSTDSVRQSLIDPNHTGYLGFVAEIEISQPALDSEAAVRAFKDKIMKMYSTPGFETTITTIGHRTNYNCGQFIKIKHNQTYPEESKKFRVSAIAHTYDSTKNEWLTKITAYQITPGSISHISPYLPPP